MPCNGGLKVTKCFVDPERLMLELGVFSGEDACPRRWHCGGERACGPEAQKKGRAGRAVSRLGVAARTLACAGDVVAEQRGCGMGAWNVGSASARKWRCVLATGTRARTLACAGGV